MKKVAFLGTLFASVFFLIIVHQVFILGNETIDSYFIEQVVLNGRSESLTILWKAITSFSSVIAIVLLTLVFFFLFSKRKEKMYFLGNVAGIVFLSQLLKFCFHRSRPLLAYQLVKESGYSFPSGHAMVSTAFYGYLLYCLWKSSAPKILKWLGSTLLPFLLLGIGFSRVYLGVHYATDVLAGFCLGVVFVLSYICFKEKDLKKEQKRLSRSFHYAGEGIVSAFLSERNMQIHVTIMFLVIFFGIYFQISLPEWITCLLLFGVVISSEIMNTAIEAVVDIAMPEKNPKAKLAKDLSAGGVLVLAVVAAIIGLLIFLPKIGL